MSSRLKFKLELDEDFVKPNYVFNASFEDDAATTGGSSGSGRRGAIGKPQGKAKAKAIAVPKIVNMETYMLTKATQLVIPLARAMTNLRGAVTSADEFLAAQVTMHQNYARLAADGVTREQLQDAASAGGDQYSLGELRSAMSCFYLFIERYEIAGMILKPSAEDPDAVNILRKNVDKYSFYGPGVADLMLPHSHIADPEQFFSAARLTTEEEVDNKMKVFKSVLSGFNSTAKASVVVMCCSCDARMCLFSGCMVLFLCLLWHLLRTEAVVMLTPQRVPSI
jgi:hypothetical protein